MPVSVVVAVTIITPEGVECTTVECSMIITTSVELSNAQLPRIYCSRDGRFRDPVADGRGAAHVAVVPGRRADAAVSRGGPAAARLGDPARLLRDPGAAVGGRRSLAPDESARRGVDVEQEPALARRSQARGARLGGAARLRDRPARPV